MMRDGARICSGLQGNHTPNCLLFPCLQNKTQNTQQCATHLLTLGRFTETVTTTRAGAFDDLFQGWDGLYPDQGRRQNKEKTGPSDWKENRPYLSEAPLLPLCLAELMSNGGQRRVNSAHAYLRIQSGLPQLKARVWFRPLCQ